MNEPPTPPALPERTSPVGLESYISGTTLISGDGPAWKDAFVQVFSRNRVQDPFVVPAVAEPLIVWVMSGGATVEERDLGGEWEASRVSLGDFFLTRSPAPYEMRWQAEGEEPFQVMHLYLSLPPSKRSHERYWAKLAATSLCGMFPAAVTLLFRIFSVSCTRNSS